MYLEKFNSQSKFDLEIGTMYSFKGYSLLYQARVENIIHDTSITLRESLPGMLSHL